VGQEAAGLTPQDLAAARDAADRFAQAIMQGDEAAARALLTGDVEGWNFNSAREAAASYELGEPVAEGSQAIVEATLRGPAPPDGGEAPSQALPIVLTQVEGEWKVDFNASITRMLGGVNLEEAMTQLVEGMGEAMKGVGEAMAQGMEAVAESLGAPELPEGEAPGFREALQRVRYEALPQEADTMAEALGRYLDVVVAWQSFRGSAEATDRIHPLVLGQLSEAIRLVAQGPEGQEKLQGALDKVVIRHVGAPGERLCVLDGGQLELAVSLLDAPGGEETAGFYTADEIAEVLRKAIMPEDESGS